MRKKLEEALGSAYASPINRKKGMDPALISSMLDELVPIYKDLEALLLTLAILLAVLIGVTLSMALS